MKNVYVSLLSLLVVTGLNAQSKPQGMLETGPVKPGKLEGKIPQKEKTNPIHNKAVIYSETFAGSAGAWTTSGPDGALWLFDTDGPNGQFSDSLLEKITSTTVANGFMIFDTDLSNADLANVQSRTGQLVSPIIDMSANPLAVITIEHTYRVCCSGLFVPRLEVSTDGFVTMESFDISSPNAVSGGSGTLATTFTSSVNISGYLDTAVNLTNFQMRINHDGSEASGISHYFWQVDDITIATPPDNDLSLQGVIWGITGAWGTVDYASAPKSQATAVEFTGMVYNNGGMAQDAVFGVTEASLPYTGASVPTNLPVATGEALSTVTDLIPSGVGTYNFNFMASSATADANPSDNTGFADSLIVTDYIYALEHGGPASIGGDTIPYEVGNIFNIVNDVTLTAADFRISSAATLGATYYISLCEVDTSATTFEKLFIPVYKSDPLFVGATGAWITMPLAIPQNLIGGKAYALFLGTPGDGFFYNTNGETNLFFNSVFIDLRADTSYFTSNNPAYLRMNFTPIPTITSTDTDNIICAPGTITLTSSANSGNLWSTGETTKSITVNATGTYSVSVGGLFSNNVDVFVNTADAITAAAGTNPTTCLGNDGKIDVTFGGAGNGTIIWTGTASGSMSGVTATAAISNLTAGGYTVTYDNGTGCVSSPMSVALSDPGAVVPVISASGATSFCPGGNVTLSSSVTGGNVWSDLSTTDVIIVSASGSYYTVNTTTPGCVGTSNVIDVVAFPTPAVDAGTDIAICAGESVFLFGSGASTYTWDNGVTDATSVTPASTTTYTVTGLDANTCVAMDAITVTVNPNPVITWTVPQACVYNSPITLNATPTGGTYSGIGISGTTFNPAGIAVGDYVIDYTVAVAGCSSVSSQIINVDSCLSVNLLDQADLSIYPNPSTGKFTVSSDNLNQYDVIELRDQLGRKVGTWKINNTIMTIDSKNIAKGNYLLVVSGKNGEMLKKIQLMD